MIKPHILFKKIYKSVRWKEAKKRVNSLSFVRITFSLEQERFYYENQIKSDNILAVGGRNYIKRKKNARIAWWARFLSQYVWFLYFFLCFIAYFSPHKS